LGGQRVTGMLHILRMLSDAVMNDRSAVPYLIAVARGAQQIPPGVMQGFRWSTGFIALASAIGCIVHISRGDWPRALGDLAKTALGLASAAGAFIDLVFSILDAVVQPVFPGLAKSPFWRLFKTFNPAQTTATAIETVIGLAWCVGVAVKNGDRAFMDEFNKVLERYDRSPLAIWTQAGQGFAVTITMLYPPARNWGFGYATLGSLVDYADQNHTLDSWY